MSIKKIADIAEFIIVWSIVVGVSFSLFSALSVVQGSSMLPQNNIEQQDQTPIIFQGNSLSASVGHYTSVEKARTVKKIRVAITAYSSCPFETDSSPFITASGTEVRDGIVAANFLPFGTKIRIPKLYGDKIFVVEDRMNPSKKYQIDIWFPSKKSALDFGVHYTYIEVVDSLQRSI